MDSSLGDVKHAYLLQESRSKYTSAKGNKSDDEAREEIWIGTEKGELAYGTRPLLCGIR